MAPNGLYGCVRNKEPNQWYDFGIYLELENQRTIDGGVITVAIRALSDTHHFL